MGQGWDRDRTGTEQGRDRDGTGMGQGRDWDGGTGRDGELDNFNVYLFYDKIVQ